MRYLLAVALLFAALGSAAPAHAETATAASPDGSLVVSVTTDGDGRVQWSLMRGGKPLIARSFLGFLFTDALPLFRGMSVTGSERGGGDDTWEQPWGERRFVRDHYTELLVHLAQTGDGERRYDVRFRLFDNGIGFRSEFPAQAGMKVARIAEEMTEFSIARPGTAWWMKGGEWNRYEQLYNKTAIDAVSTAHTPVTMRLDDGTHLAIHEAALIDYAAYRLKRGDGQTFRTELAPGSQGPRVVRSLPFETPWRTIRVADSAAGLVENDLELNLNAPNKLGDVSWVKPGKFVGIWWGMLRGDWTWGQGPRHGATTARARATIDFAAQHHIGGVLVEGWNKGWNGTWFGHGDAFSYTQAVPDFDLKAVTDYARAKGVRLIGHNETGGNIANYEAQLDDAMKLYAWLGMNAVKTGYVADMGGIIAPGDTPGAVRMEWHDGQRQVQHLLKVVETAAKYHVAIDSHEPVKDTGLRRTYPNWIAREGARGMEYNASSAYANPPGHEATLVYTRMLSGPMDFTPGILSLEGHDHAPLASTLAKQLGLYLAITSPIEMAADFIDSLAAHPREMAFIEAVPTDWAESHLIAGEVGEFAIFARKDRMSDDWWAGGVGDATARTLTLKLDFLDPGKTYTASIWKDGEGATYLTEARHRIAYETRTVKRGDTLTLWLAPGGGAAMRLHPGRLHPAR
jgi:alpha-glucosidase